MPVRAREMNDQPSESRIRQIIRSILNQEIRRVLTAESSLTGAVDTNTSNIAANAGAIAAHDTDLDNILRRAAARNNDGLMSSSSLTVDGSGVSVSSSPFAGTQVWSINVPSHPLEVTLWKQQSFSTNAAFDTFQFDAAQFDEGVLILAVDQATSPTYVPATGLFSIDWGSAKSGTLHLLNFGGGSTFSVVAVAD